MEKKYYVKKFTVLFLILTILLSNIFTTPLAVFAEGENETEDESVEQSNSVSKKGNIYNMFSTGSDAEAIGVIDTASKYDIRMQYLTTFAFLSQKYGEVGTNSNYNQIYTGGNVPGAGTIGEALNTNAQEVIENAQSINDEESTGTAHDYQETTTNDSDINKAVKDLTEGVSNELADVIISYIGTDSKTANKIVEKKTGMGTYGGPPYVYSYEIPKVKNGDRKVSKIDGKDPKEFMVKEMVSHFGPILRNGWNDFTEKELDSAEMVSTDVNGKVFNFVWGGLTPKFMKDKDDDLSVHAMADRWRRDLIGKKVFDNIKSKDQFSKGKVLSLAENDMKLDKDTLAKYVSLYPKYTESGEMGEALGKAVSDYLLSDKGQKQFKAYVEALRDDKEQQRKAGDAVGTDSRILTYITLRPYIDEKRVKDDKILGTGWAGNEVGFDNFKDLLDKADNSELDDGLIRKKGGDWRSVQINDIFPNEKMTPVFVMNTEETYSNYLQHVYGQTEISSNGISLGKYAGMATERKGIFTSDGWQTLLSQPKDKMIKWNMNSSNSSNWPYNVEEHDGYQERFTKIITSNYEVVGSKEVVEDNPENPIGVDSYGNIINTETGTILIPYWHNATTETLMPSGNMSKAWVSHPVFLEKAAQDVIDSSDILIDLVNAREGEVTASEVNAAFSNVSEAPEVSETDLSKIKQALNNPNSFNSIHEIFVDSEGKPNTKNIQLLAMMITAKTKNQVEAWNKEMLGYGKDGQELFIGIGDGDYGGSSASGDLEGYTNADLREKIGMILDYGFFEVLKLTFASMVVSIYNSGFAGYSLSSIFHTTTIADTAMWSDLVRALGFILIGFMACYVVFMAFRVFRQTMRFKDFIAQFLIVSLIILVPTVVYSPVINTLINKPTTMILGDQIEQSSILDTYLKRNAERKERDEFYRYMFAEEVEQTDKTQDYIIDFYTTQHKSGFDITEPSATEGLGFRDQVRSMRAIETGEWNKNDVLKVSVSMFDVYDWLIETVDYKMDAEGKKEGPPMEYKPLFEYLASHPQKAERYEDLSGFEEFKYDTNMLAKRLGGVEQDDDSGLLSASDLLREMWLASAAKDTNGNDIEGGRALADRIVGMYDVARYVKYTTDSDKVVTAEEIEGLVRDLSLTHQGRITAFGIENSPGRSINNEPIAGVSDKTQALWDRLDVGMGRSLPPSDYMNLEGLIDNIIPVPDPTAFKTRDRIIYNTNEKVLNDYINVQSVVRDSLGSASALKETESLFITLNAFFRLNEEAQLPMFPTEIKPSTISLDTFLRMIYVPFHEYKGNPEAMDNIAEYLTLRYNPLLMFVTFLPALVALTLWGMLYLAVFSFVMMIAATVSFFWNYIIKEDRDNKAWLGTLIIIGTFAIAKIGLLLIWYLMGYIMNFSYTRMGGTTYAHVHVHSLIITAYVLFCFKFLFLRVFKAVRESPKDMGASQFANQAREVIRGIADKNNHFKMTRKLGKMGEKFSKGAFAVGAALAYEGSKGAVNAAKASRDIKKAEKLAMMNNAIGTDVADIASVATGTGAGIIKRFPKLTKGFKGKATKQMLEDYDGISASIGGLSTDTSQALQSSGQVGHILSNTADGVQIATMAVGNKEQASIIADHLKEKGIDAKVSKNGNVSFPTNEYDLGSKDVRKGLYGGLVDNLYKEIDGASKVEAGSVNNSFPYRINEDGSVSVKVGDTGLSPVQLDNLMNSSALSSGFIVNGKPAKQANGEYTQGFLELQVKKDTDVTKSMEQVFSEDTKLRKSTGEQARGKNEINKSIKFENLEQDQSVYNYLQDGMEVQKNKVLYDSRNKSHVKAIKKITEDIRKRTDSNYQDKIDLMKKISAQTAYGGNNGFLMDYQNTSQDEKVLKHAREAGLVGDDIESIVYAGPEAKEVANQLKVFQQIKNIGDEDKINYQKAQQDLFVKGEEHLLRGSKEGMYDRGFNNLVDLASQVGENHKTLEAFNTKYAELGTQLNHANILPEEYDKKVEGLFNALQFRMQENGTYTKAVTTDLNKKDVSKEAKKSLNEYTKAKQTFTKKGISEDMIDKLQEPQFNELLNITDDIKDVEAREDGTLKVKSIEKLNDKDTERLISKLNKKFTKSKDAEDLSKIV